MNSLGQAEGSPQHSLLPRVLGSHARSKSISDDARKADCLEPEWPSSFRTLLLKKTIDAQEAERRRIARDIHDESEQLLGNAIFRLDMCMMQQPEIGEPIKKDLDKIRHILIETVEGLQNLAHSLRPSLLDDLGLEASLAWFFRTSGLQERMSVQSRITGKKGRLPAAVETTVFRIVQEAGNNVLKHAKAKNLRVSIRISESRVLVVVSDDGIGMDTRALSPIARPGDRKVHMGLGGMKERVELLGGKFRLRSCLHEGTRIVVVIPLGYKTEELSE